ncbi:MAG: hypothetical protein LKF87_13785 [Clostridium tyrobutyricum]|jgi:hypothetical protein|uniref:hypothetical protein n=1 Tax=Clostridium tyrobutyricum TaxID=1519 RepID=UPI00242D280C|nr:hypothetical protein [Clostridium tyrobutyricum]MCH4259989.1 hypothetical protein [Clostridium tyrobutyricum]MCI1239671.1 hypothetical protein [Clostridium tyrobutyricum]MCI1652374.1 hypothetical protein [Clostridium tyrobutyricum]MCI1938083.1 hypothetical protein [Clostridium tyrobutyricum]MCI1993363.1 hypothetical protein [Clostridium tyrobutyricum]
MEQSMPSIKHKNLKFYKTISKIALLLGIMLFVFFITHSTLIASILGTSVLKVGEILAVVYRAYRAGASIRAAVTAALGPGAAVGFLVSILVGYGISAVMGSPTLQSY